MDCATIRTQEICNLRDHTYTSVPHARLFIFPCQHIQSIQIAPLSHTDADINPAPTDTTYLTPCFSNSSHEKVCLIPLFNLIGWNGKVVKGIAQGPIQRARPLLPNQTNK